jgi:GNAT superfamily N-acetyltransferase
MRGGRWRWWHLVALVAAVLAAGTSLVIRNNADQPKNAATAVQTPTVGRPLLRVPASWELFARGPGVMVVPEVQGRGIAVAATAQAIELAKRDGKHRFMHAFPNVDNAPSNAICRRLGFELLQTCEFEFPKGHFMTCHDWRLDLHVFPGRT